MAVPSWRGLDIYDQLIHSGKTIITIGYRVMSIATVILLAAEKENRKLSSHASFLIHMPLINASVLGDMTSDELAELADDLRKWDSRILDLYVERTGSDRAELESIMKEDKVITPEAAQRLGFVTEIMAGATSAKAAKAYAFTPLAIKAFHKNQIPMSELKEVVTGLKALTAEFKNFFGGKGKNVKNASVKTEDGNTTIYYEGDAIAEGTPCFSDEGMTTPLAEGSYTLDDGQTITVDASGVVTAIAPAEATAEASAEVKALTEELEQANAQNAALAASIKKAGCR